MQWANKCNIVWKNVNSSTLSPSMATLQCVIDRKALKLLYNLQKKNKKAMETCVIEDVCIPVMLNYII